MSVFSLLHLDLDRSYFWSNYTMSATVGATRMGGFVFRYIDSDHYYRFITDRSRVCWCAVVITAGAVPVIMLVLCPL